MTWQKQKQETNLEDWLVNIMLLEVCPSGGLGCQKLNEQSGNTDKGQGKAKLQKDAHRGQSAN